MNPHLTSTDLRAWLETWGFILVCVVSCLAIFTFRLIVSFCDERQVNVLDSPCGLWTNDACSASVVKNVPGGFYTEDELETDELELAMSVPLGYLKKETWNMTISVSATAFALAPVVPLLCQPTQIPRPQIDGSIIRASSPAPPTSIPTIAPVLHPLEWWWSIACEPVSGVPRRSGFPANEEALNLVVRTVGMRPCKLFSETLKVSRLVTPPRVPGMEPLSLLFPRSKFCNGVKFPELKGMVTWKTFCCRKNSWSCSPSETSAGISPIRLYLSGLR